MAMPEKERESVRPRAVVFPEAELTRAIIGCFYRVNVGLGAKHAESVYNRALGYELGLLGIGYQAEAPIDVYYKGVVVGTFRADLIVERRVLVESKATPALVPGDFQQVMNYLRCTDIEVGLLLRFGGKANFERLVYSNAHKAMLDRR